MPNQYSSRSLTFLKSSLLIKIMNSQFLDSLKYILFSNWSKSYICRDAVRQSSMSMFWPLSSAS